MMWKNKFIDFLNEKGILDKFKKNLNADMEDFMKIERPQFFIWGAFIWSSSPEGIEYWSKISSEWKEEFYKKHCHKCNAERRDLCICIKRS